MAPPEAIRGTPYMISRVLERVSHPSSILSNILVAAGSRPLGLIAGLFEAVLNLEAKLAEIEKKQRENVSSLEKEMDIVGRELRRAIQAVLEAEEVSVPWLQHPSNICATLACVIHL
eukprot:1190404-Prorocentrum_minimum.AAC.3